MILDTQSSTLKTLKASADVDEILDFCLFLLSPGSTHLPTEP